MRKATGARNSQNVTLHWIIIFVLTALIRWKQWVHVPTQLIYIAMFATGLTIGLYGVDWWRAQRQARHR